MSVVQYGTLTDLPAVLTAVRDQIATGTGIPKHLIFPSLLPDEEFEKSPPGNTFVVVRPERFTLIQSVATGAAHAAFDGRLLISLWHRLNTDQAVREANWLLRDPEGVLAKWLALLAALHLYYPQSGDGSIFIEPMRPDDGFRFPTKRPPGWGKLESAWQVLFNHRLS